ncbi:MAG: hypothetical protein HGA87_02775 [Desulfobulbaceae bacterium]|nr:hypothetical protein [Desulfobulbaceae bacterium]
MNAKLLRGGRVSKRTEKKYHLKTNPYLKEYKKQSLETYSIKVPKHFCFLVDPQGTSDFLASLKKLLNKKPRNYYIDHTETETIGPSPSYLFDELIKGEIEFWRAKKIRINVGGEISKTKKVNNFLLACGLLKSLKITAKVFSKDRVDWDYANKYLTFDYCGNKKSSLHSSIGASRLVDYFNKCFNHNSFELTEFAKSELIGTIAEIIGNAEEHCGNEEGEWVVLGAYDKDEHICRFSILNKGRSIYESLSSKDSTAAEVLEEVQSIIIKHKPIWEKAGRVFRNEDEETIWNVMALQDGISSKRTASGTGNSRGQGIMDVLEFVDTVKAGDGGAIICLLSGKSVIKIDYEYPIIEKAVGPQKEKRRMMIFNKNQTLHDPSDENKVRVLANGFPGTIFTGSFKIDEKYLRRVLDGKKRENN